jgi:hypothetical protein
MKLDRRNDPVTITDFRHLGSRETSTRSTVTIWMMAAVIILAIIVKAVVR